jgi:CRISPR-associated protein Cas2
MWLVAMFDLPVDTKEARRQYTLFRKELLKDGFSKMQFSVYIRHCASEENAAVHGARVERALPPDGEVRVLFITDKQFERMRVFWGRMRKPVAAAPAQLEMF